MQKTNVFLYLNTVSHSHIVFKTGHQRTCRISVGTNKVIPTLERDLIILKHVKLVSAKMSSSLRYLYIQRKQISWTPKKSTMCSSKILPFLRPFKKKNELWDSQKLFHWWVFLFPGVMSHIDMMVKPKQSSIFGKFTPKMPTTC